MIQASPNIIAFAIKAHADTNHLYDGNKPYAVHLAMVVGYAHKHIDCIPKRHHKAVLEACWLHDTIEDCRMTYNDIKKVAGEQVADIVYAVTNEKGKSREERANEKYYDGIVNTDWARFVKLCDRLANVAYGVDNNSTRMLDKYKKENEHFLSSMFRDDREGGHLKPLVDELNSMFHLDQQINLFLRNERHP